MTLLTFAQATVGLSALAQLPPSLTLFLLLRPAAQRDAVPVEIHTFFNAETRKKEKGASWQPCTLEIIII